ncbi:MAG: sigma-70 family RNA polymerase sigma factor [Anaerolineales bacterium]
MGKDVQPSSATDGDLIRQAQAGDREAFGEIYRRYLSRIYGYVRLRVSTVHEAEDLTEMVFLKSFESLGRYRDRGTPFAAYLYKIARHTVIDSYRSRDPSVPLEAMEDHADDAPGAETSLVDREQKNQSMAALARIPERYQEVIRLRVLLGLPTETVAAWLGARPATIRVLLHRALKALRGEMHSSNENG